MNTLDKCAAGAGGGPLSREQKKRVCLAARAGWERCGRPGFADQGADLPAEIRLSEREAFDLWRQGVQSKATGISHLTCMPNREFPRLMQAFADLAGKEDESERWARRGLGDPQRQALAVLRREFARVRDVIEDPQQYVASIARSKFKSVDVEGLNAKQVWSLVFDLRRGAQKRRQHVQGVPF